MPACAQGEGSKELRPLPRVREGGACKQGATESCHVQTRVGTLVFGVRWGRKHWLAHGRTGPELSVPECSLRRCLRCRASEAARHLLGGCGRRRRPRARVGAAPVQG
jgi:hypothetical protein